MKPLGVNLRAKAHLVKNNESSTYLEVDIYRQSSCKGNVPFLHEVIHTFHFGQSKVHHY